jgi:D-sedoheptulose 7-phosphate isomerase
MSLTPTTNKEFHPSMQASFSSMFLDECKSALEQINANDIEDMAEILAKTRNNNGRLFILGSGGGAGHASHAVCDFRKLCNFEAYSPYDNISELTARVNDEGWQNTIINWLKGSKLSKKDALLVFSVGGGNSEKNISMNIVSAIEYAKEIGAKVVGIVGKDGGTTKAIGDAVTVIPTINASHITPITEGFQAVVWHLLVSHPKLQQNPTKWESTK